MLTAPYIPENAPFSARQRSWLNGYLAGLFAAGAQVDTQTEDRSAASSVPLLILYGSQTGTAEGLARRLAKEAKAMGCDARVVDGAAYASVDWQKETYLWVVTSTYGDGEMPDNIQGFWDWLQTDSARGLAHLRFAVLALGDTNYAEFCAAGKKLDARLEELGAQRLVARADCNVDYAATAREWSTRALAALAPAGSGAAALVGSSRHAAPVTSVEPAPFSRENPFPARLVTNRRLNGPGSAKETRHVEIALENSGLSYEAGDALGVAPTNCPELVEAILQALGCDGEESVATPGQGELPLRKALGTCYDLGQPSSELLQRLARRDTVLAALLAPEAQDALRKWLRGRGVIDLLAMGDEPLTPNEFVKLLRPLAPRLYSISSSLKAHPAQVHLTVNIVRYEAFGRSRKGAASTFLADRVGPDTAVPVFIHKAPNFRLPTDGSTPVIMVGPGTGVAPFRAFLHERRAVAALGRNWLFFGEQCASTDFYYREELEQMAADGWLTRLDTAFSRDQAHKIYVQHRMLEQAALLWEWLQQGAHFYVCGDAARMAKDVDAALHEIAERAGGLGKEGAIEFVKQLKANKRYQRDVY